MLACVPETKMLSKRYAFTIFLDLGEAQKILACYSKSDKSTRSTLQQIMPPGVRAGYFSVEK